MGIHAQTRFRDQ